MSEKARRILMAVFGVTLCGAGAGLMTYAGLGIDPFQVFSRGVWGLGSLDFGTFYVLLNALMLVFIFFWNRHMIGLGTVINLFGVGYIVEWSRGAMQAALPAPTLPARLGVMLAALVLCCLASALYFTADLGVSTYDAIALTLAQRTSRLPFRVIRILCDLACVGIGCALGAGAMAGVCTVVCALGMGPLISFFNRTVAQPLLSGRRPAARRRPRLA